MTTGMRTKPPRSTTRFTEIPRFGSASRAGPIGISGEASTAPTTAITAPAIATTATRVIAVANRCFRVMPSVASVR